MRTIWIRLIELLHNEVLPMKEVYRRFRIDLKFFLLNFQAKLFEFAFFLTYFLAFLVFNPEIQNKPYGPLCLGIGLASFQWILVYLLEINSDKLELKFLIVQKSFLERRSAHMNAVFFLVLILSLAQNNSISGALNPVAYWRSERQEVGDSCNGMQKVLANAAEEMQVAQNKHRFGIATTQEVVLSIEFLKITSDAYNNCLDLKMRHMATINAQLKRLGVN